MQFERFYSLKDSIVGSFPHLHHLGHFSKLSQIWGNLCGGNGVSVLPYAHPQLFNSLTAIRVLAGKKNSRPVGFYSRNSTKSTVNPNTTIPQI